MVMTAKNKKLLANTSLRVFAVFLMQAMAIVGGASIVGGIPVWKAALLSGISASAQVLQKLAAAFIDDGKITAEELDAAFAMSNKVSSKNSD